MKLVPLASSSHGNAYLVDDGESVLLLECGLSYRRLSKLIREAGYAVTRLSGVLITHEHKDHAQCWDKLAAAALPVYASDGTIEALGAEGRLIPLAPAPGRDVSEPLQIGSYDVLAFRTFHDAREPIGFLIRSRADGDKLAFATDTVNLRYSFPGINILAIEANYQDAILAKNTRMPDSVIRRVQNTHMEIETLCGYLSELNLDRCRAVYLTHLSDASSDEAWFAKRVRRVVPGHVEVIVCPRGG